MNRQEALDQVCREYGLLAVYLFGSRADDGLRLLRGEAVSREGSDLDIGLVFKKPSGDLFTVSRVQAYFEGLFAPLRIALVILQQVDALFQFSAIDGHRVVATDRDEADKYELLVGRIASEVRWLQRQMGSQDSPFSLL
jgi:predicted nucleotidyltransferase